MADITVVPVDFESSGSSFRVICELDDGSGKLFKEWIPFPSLEGFRLLVKERNAQITDTGTLADDIKPLIGVPFDYSDPVPPPPTPKDKFAADVKTLKQMAAAISLGVLSASDSAYLALKTSVTTTLTANPSWVDVF
jgi:hypothetical protein